MVLFLLLCLLVFWQPSVAQQIIVATPGTPAAPPGGSTGQFQFNQGGAFGGTTGIAFDTTPTLATSGWKWTSTGLSGTFSNPTLGNDLNLRRVFDVASTTDGSVLNPVFSTDIIARWSRTSVGPGQNNYDANSKTTFINQQWESLDRAQGQHIGTSTTMFQYAMGDVYTEDHQAYLYGGTNAGGDEGQGGLRLHLEQPGPITAKTISSIPTPSTCSTTLTQNVTKNVTPQTVTVVSSTGCTVNDRLVIDQGDFLFSKPRMEIVKVTAVASGTITAQFRENHQSGDSVQAALLLTLNSGSNLGAGRYLVNYTAPSYSAGTVSSISGSTFTGTGTTWAVGMVGGTALLPGCVALTADDVSISPFNGANGPLKGWHGIGGVTDATHLYVAHFKEATHPANYKGLGPGSGGYIVRPCVRVLEVSGSNIWVEPNSFPWAVSDNVVLAHSVDLSITALIRAQAFIYSPNAELTTFYSANNFGSAIFSSAFYISSLSTTVPAFNTLIASTAGTQGSGIYVQGQSGNGRLIETYTYSGDSKNIYWGASAGSAQLGVDYTTGSLIATLSTAGAVLSVNRPVKFAGTNTTGAGSALLGANSPATTLSAPYTWIQVVTADGQTAFIPAWK